MKRENKIIRCGCGQEINIPAELDEDYDKNMTLVVWMETNFQMGL